MTKIKNLIIEIYKHFSGDNCPECGVRPLKPHTNICSIGKWDGGTWA
jgi:hypothetical protein